MKPFVKKLGLCPICLGLLLSSCSDGKTDAAELAAEPEAQVEKNVQVSLEARGGELSEAEKTIAASMGDFAWRFFIEGCSEGKDNLVLSPLSASIALSLLANGADGATLDEILNALGIASGDIEDLNALNAKVAYAAANADEAVTLKLANSFWHVPGLTVLDSYLERLSGCYDADIMTIVPSTLLGDINGWISDKTEGLIPQFYTETPQFDFALANALYFKARWAEGFAFSPYDTDRGAFANADGSTSIRDFMFQEATLAYECAASYRRCVLPMGQEGIYSFSIVLPNEGVGIEKCASAMAGRGDSALAEALVSLTLPKFEIEQKMPILDMLKRMGMESLCSDDCDLSRMLTEGAVISSADQAVSMKVDEEGTEAAATTALGLITEGSGTWKRGIDFSCDRPFLYYITENYTGSVLFIGRVDKL